MQRRRPQEGDGRVPSPEGGVPGVEDRGAGPPHAGPVVRVWKGRLERAGRGARAAGHRGVPDEKVNKLSGGTLQKLGFAQAILHEPSVLVLDEPMAALDPASRFLFKKIIRDLRPRGRPSCSRPTSSPTSRTWPTRSASCSPEMPLLRADQGPEGWSPSAPSWWSSCPRQRRVEVGEPPRGRPAAAVRRMAGGPRRAISKWDATVPKLIEALMNAGCTIRSFNRHDPKLEDLYMAYMGGSN